MYFVSTDGRIREREREKGGVGGGFGVRSEEEEEGEEEMKGRLIMKVFQIASPWRSGAWRGFRGFGLSTSAPMPGV